MSHVPLWVYAMFFSLIYLGVKRCYKRVISIERIFIAPAFFVYLSIRNTASLFQFSWLGFSLLFMGLVAGLFFGYRHIRRLRIRSDKKNKLIEIPGDVSMLVMVMAIFFIEFFIHYAFDAGWPVSRQTVFKEMAVLLSGIIMGISLGRSITYLMKYRGAESVDLVTQ